MRNLYRLILLGVILASSCELDRFPEVNLSDVDFWNSEDNFKDACNIFYVTIDGEALFFDDNKTDFGYNAGSGGANEISSGTRITPAVSEDWNTDYRMIFNANNIIEKAENAKDIESINRWIAEAKFWRAFAYFDLVSKYGDVPLVLSTLDIDSPKLTESRTERAVVINQIYDDLDYAKLNLPSFIELGRFDDYGRVSKSTALALKARAALYEGTRQKFHSYGDPSSNLSIAVNAAEAVMAEGHELYPSYNDLFQLEGEGFGNKENILAVIYGIDDDEAIRSHNITTLTQNAWHCVTRPLVELYLCTDGLPIEKSPLAKPDTSYISIFKNKDPRMDVSLFKTGDKSNNPDIWRPDVKQSVVTAYSARKFYNPADWAKSRSYIDIPMFRYAEVLLIYAEAIFELNGSISESDLDKSINLLRDRVSMPHLTNALVEENELDMRFEIRRERSVELAMEGFRYNDIIRWKIAENVLPQEMVGSKYFPEFGNRIVSSKGYLLAQKGSTRHFDPNRDYLYPIPTREISLSDGQIVQNPGW